VNEPRRLDEGTVAFVATGNGRASPPSVGTDAADGTMDYRPPAGPGTVDDRHEETARTTDRPAEPGAATVDRGRDQTAGSRGGFGAPDTMKPGKARVPGAPASVAGYEILGVLGRGAMGVVYKAKQKGLNRLVALKMILAGGHASEREIARFRIEAEAVAQVHHPNIVQIYDIGEEDGKPYFSLEFVDGVSLHKKIDGTPQPPRQAAEFALQMARGMEAAHQKGVIHRDLKPANILVTKDGVAKVTDFGLAKRVEAESGQTHAGTVLGTPSYMPPEQAEGRNQQVGPLSDVYSLGAVLYEMLTGRPPFRGATMLDTLQLVRTQEPVPPSQFQPGLPVDLETICLKCLQKDPVRRYASAADLAEDLRRFLGGEPILARPVGSVERAVRWCRRNPRIAVLTAAVVALVILWAGTSSVLAVIAHNNAREAEENQKKAEAEAARANSEAKRANENADDARKNEATAVKNLKVAVGRQEVMFQRMIALGEALQKKLRSRKISEKLAPEAKKVQDEFMTVLRDKMIELAREFEATDLTTFSSAAAYQELGDLLYRLGRGKEALKQYEQAYKLIKKVADDDRDNNMARGNLGMMTMRLGDVALERDGDARAALDYYKKGWDLQYKISLHPDQVYTEVRNKILLSHHAIRIGRAYLDIGDSAAALRQLQKALKLRQEFNKAVSSNREGRSFLAEVYLYLGMATARQGDANGLEYLAESLKLAEGIVRERQDIPNYKVDVVVICGALGDAQVLLGKADEATKSYEKERKTLDQLLKANPDDPSLQPLLAELEGREAADAMHRGKKPEAEKHFQKALKVREDLVLLEPANRAWQASYVLALAHCGRCATADRKADALRKESAKLPAILLQLARGYAVCAGKDKKGEDGKKALAALKELPALGFRDAALLKADPDLAAVRTDPAFRSLVDGLAKK
jgi:serine/threonine-protein kinase